MGVLKKECFFLIGVYGYGAKTTSPENRAMTLARYDGFELIARVTGALVSPIIANNVDRYANFGLKLACDLFAVLYLIFIIKDTPRIIESNKKRDGDDDWVAQMEMLQHHSPRALVSDSRVRKIESL